MNRLISAIILGELLLPSAVAGKSPKEILKPKVILQKTGEAVNMVGDAVTLVTEKISEPIRDPKAAVSTWFDYNPLIESGEKKNINILPLFVTSPERGQGVGIEFAQESVLKKQDLLRFHIVHTLKNRSSFELFAEPPPKTFANCGVELHLAYENYTRFYYGMGNASQEEDKSTFDPQYFDIRVPVLYRWTNEWSLGLSFNYQNWKITDIQMPSLLNNQTPSLFGTIGTRLYSTSILARWDTRNHRQDPSRGSYLEGKYEYSKKVWGSEADYNRAAAEFRHFFQLFSMQNHVFAIHLQMDYKSGDVPFYLLPELGGIYFNRGLIEGRFRDSLLLAGNWEYRFKIYQRLHWAFFVDAGNVYPQYRSFQISHIKITGGTGMRYYVPPGNLLLARIDAGISSEGTLIYLTFDHPF